MLPSVAFLLNSFHTGEKERERKENKEKREACRLFVAEADVTWAPAVITRLFLMVNYFRDGMFGGKV